MSFVFVGHAFAFKAAWSGEQQRGGVGRGRRESMTASDEKGQRQTALTLAPSLTSAKFR